MQGILLLDKPVGISSNAALQIVKRLFKADKAGHTGSLDPLASGMLPICLGPDATKFSQFLLDAEKHYQVVACLGASTTTGDAEGEIINEVPLQVLKINSIEQVLQGFLGDQTQIPPMYSALKHDGQPLYKLARRGIEIERQPRFIQIYCCQLLEYTRSTLSLRIHCSKGTYIRTLVTDIGKKLGCGAYVRELRRLQVGNFDEKQMIALNLLEALDSTQRLNHVLPVDTMIQSWPFLELDSIMTKLILQGQAVKLEKILTPGMIRLYENSNFIGIGQVLENGKVVPKRLIAMQH